jgi:DNA-binding FadR family transcriptional regulator
VLSLSEDASDQQGGRAGDGRARREVQYQTVDDHRAIVAALRARDPEAASAAMYRHIENVERA